MKVAVIGAGLAGLACSIELERHGIIPDIFERQNSIGSLLSLSACTLRLFGRTALDPASYFKKKYNLEIKPHHKLKRIFMQGPAKKVVINSGSLGYVFLRGVEKGSLENQLAGYIDFPVNFNRNVSLDQVRDKYDIVVAATGDGTFAKSMNAWKYIMDSHVRVARIIGSFRPGTIKMWLNAEYCRNCCCYLLPFNEKEAELTMLVGGIAHDELEHYWKEFLIKAELSCTIIETRDSEQHIGYPEHLRMGNVLFTGNAGGLCDSLLGFGSMQAIESGILAARAIAEGKDYEKLARPLQRLAGNKKRLTSGV